jgi:hypothetical protein
MNGFWDGFFTGGCIGLGTGALIGWAWMNYWWKKSIEKIHLTLDGCRVVSHEEAEEAYRDAIRDLS